MTLSDDRLELALERTDSVFFEIDAESGAVSHLGELDRLFGVDEAAIPTWEAFERRVVHPRNAAEFERSVRRILSGEIDEDSIEYRIRVDGEVRWIKTDVYAEPDPESGRRYAVGIARDVTDRKRRERELETLSGFLRSLYDVTTDRDYSFEEKIDRLLAIGCAELDLPYGFLTRISAEGVAGADDVTVPVADDVVTGAPPSDRQQTIVRAHGSHPELQPGESCPLSEAYCRKTIETPDLLAIRDAGAAGWDGDPAYERFDLGSYVGGKVIVDGELYGTLCFAATSARDRPVSDAERSMVRLLTKWTSYELERRRSTAELRDRNERLERFASIVSHDLRNPLNVAIGRLDLAMEADRSDATADETDAATDETDATTDETDAATDETDADRREHLAAIDRSLDRMDALITDLLTLAREGESITETGPVALADCCRDCWVTVETADADLSIRTDAVVDADRSRLTQVLENLFGNAVEHGGQDVTITVGTLPNGDGFYVADDGPGIPDADRDRVFEAGHSTANDGTGFGLSIVREITAGHGWNVRVTDAESGGARFEFTGVDLETSATELPTGDDPRSADRDGESASEE
ncbi:ATP-binding protein [Halopenitus persicus]|uniref:ATP-binding protein n=1 Tax=Halopenitus persicus TaxID=1048396 RepID=UPI00156044B2|nr:ATP-binding protein [Halopenitus persicus]